MAASLQPAQAHSVVDAVAAAHETRALGPGRLADMLDGGTREDAITALRLLPELEEAALFLEDVVQLLTHAEAAVADEAGSALAAIAGRLTPDDVARWEISADDVLGGRAAAEAVAGSANRRPSTRIACLRALPRIYALTGGVPGPWARGLLEDTDPDVRLAALDLLATFPSTADDEALARAVDDPVVAVAAHAARTICERAADPDPILVPLVGRIRALAREPSFSRNTRDALRRCAAYPASWGMGTRGARK